VQFVITMQFFGLSILLTLTAYVAGKELPKDQFKAAALYDSGLKHEMNIARKKVRLAYSFNPFIMRTNTRYIICLCSLYS
jgi:hypothetical protein